jgi:hypothetical protein
VDSASPISTTVFASSKRKRKASWSLGVNLPNSSSWSRHCARAGHAHLQMSSRLLTAFHRNDNKLVAETHRQWGLWVWSADEAWCPANYRVVERTARLDVCDIVYILAISRVVRVVNANSLWRWMNNQYTAQPTYYRTYCLLNNTAYKWTLMGHAVFTGFDSSPTIKNFNCLFNSDVRSEKVVLSSTARNCTRMSKCWQINNHLSHVWRVFVTLEVSIPRPCSCSKSRANPLLIYLFREF